MEAYQFQALPFSLSSAPWIFMMVLREVVQYVHRWGIKFHFNLDNWLIRHRNPAILSDHLQFVLDLAACLAWLVNLKKSDLVPRQQFTYLGLDFDTVLALVRLSLKHVKRHLHQVVLLIPSDNTMTVSYLTKQRGLIWLCCAALHGRSSSWPRV